MLPEGCSHAYTLTDLRLSVGLQAGFLSFGTIGIWSWVTLCCAKLSRTL